MVDDSALVPDFQSLRTFYLARELFSGPPRPLALAYL